MYILEISDLINVFSQFYNPLNFGAIDDTKLKKDNKTKYAMDPGIPGNILLMKTIKE